MTRLRHLATPPPSLVAVYIEFTGTGSDVHTEYLRRWTDWHAATCGRPECLRHVPRVPYRKRVEL